MGLKLRINIKVLFVLLVIYVLLFDFVLPPLKAFPRVELIWESFLYLVAKHKILSGLGMILSGIYISFLVAFISLFLFKRQVFALLGNYPLFFRNLNIFGFATPLVFTGIFVLFFSDGILSEFAFLFILSLSFLINVFSENFPARYVTYEEAALGLGKNRREISNVVWKGLLPFVKESLPRFHKRIWLYVLLLQMFYASNLGGVFYQLIEFKDYAGFYAFAIALWIVIGVNHLIIKYFAEKVIFWDREE